VPATGRPPGVEFNIVNQISFEPPTLTTLQIDGSEHAWFEERGAPCTLLAFVDDATRRLMQLRSSPSRRPADPNRSRLGGSHPVCSCL
jgi:hypothetical protein